MSVSDPKIRQKIGVTSVPKGVNDVVSGSITIAANTTRTFIVTITPADQNLNLWNFLFSVVVDDISRDSDGNYNYIFPEGPLLSDAQRNMRIIHWIDWAKSSDLTNIRVHKIRIENDDSSSHTYYLYYKAYTFATNTGSAS